MANRTCPGCDAPIAGGDVFCRTCGARLEPLTSRGLPLRGIALAVATAVVLGASVAAASTLFAGDAQEALGPILMGARVSWVEDGDTICVELDGIAPTGAQQSRCTLDDAPPGVEDWPVRLIGIDAPELTPTLECYALEATEELRRLIEGRRVVLEFDPAQHVDGTADRRILAYVWLDDRFINDEIVRTGFAEERHAFPGIGEVETVAHREQFVEAEIEARQAAAGLWSACTSGESPWARLEICVVGGPCIDEHEELHVETSNGTLPVLTFDASRSRSDGRGEIVGYDWLINGPPTYSGEVLFEFESSLLQPGPNHVQLTATDAVGSVSAPVGATLVVPDRGVVLPTIVEGCATDGLLIAGDHGLVVTEECGVRSVISDRPVALAVDDLAGGVIFQYEPDQVFDCGNGADVGAPRQPIYHWPVGADAPGVLLDEGDRAWGTFILHDVGRVDGRRMVLFTDVFQEELSGCILLHITLRTKLMDLDTGEVTVLAEWASKGIGAPSRGAFGSGDLFDVVLSPVGGGLDYCGDEFGLWNYGLSYFDSSGAEVAFANSPTVQCDEGMLLDAIGGEGSKIFYATTRTEGDLIVHHYDLTTGGFVGPVAPIRDLVDRISTDGSRLAVSAEDTVGWLYALVEDGGSMGACTEEAGADLSMATTGCPAPVAGIVGFVRSTGGLEVGR